MHQQKYLYKIIVALFFSHFSWMGNVSHKVGKGFFHGAMFLYDRGSIL